MTAKTSANKPTTRKMMKSFLLLSTLLTLLPTSTTARRGALVRDGMSSKSAYDNPLRAKGDMSIDPVVNDITTRIPRWSIEPISTTTTTTTLNLSKEDKDCIQCITKHPLDITFRSKALAGGKRSNWMRCSALVGNPSLHRDAQTVRAVWTVTSPDSPDSDMGLEQGTNVLEDSYEDCVKRLYGKFVEVEVLLPKKKHNSVRSPPPSVVYRVPIMNGHVNRLGMVAKSRASVTFYPNGRTLASAGGGAGSVATKSSNADVGISLGMTNVHLPTGPGLVDPSWARGKKLFWKGRSVGVL